MRLHNPDNLAVATENLLPLCSRVRNKEVVSSSYQLYNDRWKHQPSFWNKEATATQLTRKATVTQSGYYHSRFHYRQEETDFFGVVPRKPMERLHFHKDVCGQGLRTQLLKKRQNLGVEALSSSSTKTRDRLSQTTCLNVTVPGSTGRA